MCITGADGRSLRYDADKLWPKLWNTIVCSVYRAFQDCPTKLWKNFWTKIGSSKDRDEHSHRVGCGIQCRIETVRLRMWSSKSPWERVHGNGRGELADAFLPDTLLATALLVDGRPSSDRTVQSIECKAHPDAPSDCMESTLRSTSILVPKTRKHFYQSHSDRTIFNNFTYGFVCISFYSP